MMTMPEMLAHLKERASHMIGYPINCEPSCSEELAPFLATSVNNIGDPFTGSNLGINTMEYEVEVVVGLAGLLHLADYWGYVTSCGSEGNWRGISLGLTAFPDAVVYRSDRAHYSVHSAIATMRADEVVVGTLDDHRIDVNDLRRRLDKTRPAVLCLTAGTTMAGAVDDVPAACEALRHSRSYVHVDAALSGLILPFLPDPPKFDFAVPGVDSLSVSGHKMLGTPFCCGVFLSRRRHRPVAPVEYVGSSDATIFGSRNGLAPAALRVSLAKAHLPTMVAGCMSLAADLADSLSSVGWPCWRLQHANIVMLRRPPLEIVQKWQLATDGEWAHVVVMPHVTAAMLSEFVADLRKVLEPPTRGD